MARRSARVSLTCQSYRCRPVRACRQLAKREFSSDLLVVQFASGTTPQQIGNIAQRFGLTAVAQETIGMLGRTVYTFRIANGQSVREVIRRVEAAGLHVAVQPNYTFRLTQDRNNPNADLGDPAQYIVNKFTRSSDRHQHDRRRSDGVLRRNYSAGSMQVRILSRRYSSLRNP